MAKLNKKNLILLLGLVIFPSLAQANAGVPMIFLVMPAFALSIVPIIIIEAIYISKKLELPGKESAKTVTISNLVSTIVGTSDYHPLCGEFGDYSIGLWMHVKISMYQFLIPGMTPVQVVAHNLENDNYPHSYKSAIVAGADNDIIGMALSYPSSYHKITDEMRAFFPAERLARFEDFYAARVEDSLFLDALGVAASYRRQGIGTRLVELTKEKARKNGYKELSLIVFADNAPALALYKFLGFETVQRIKLEGNQFIPHQEGCVLLRCKAA